MSLNLSNHRLTRPERPFWSGAAFIVESLLLLVFLVFSLAIFAQASATSIGKAGESAQLTHAVTAASNVAEHFAADPTSVEKYTSISSFVVVCDTVAEDQENGTLYNATLSVYDNKANDEPQSAATGEPVYTLTTARYVSEVSR